MEDNLTVGEARVRTTFNPSANETVDQIKQKSAEIINLVHSEFGEKGAPNTEANRLREKAMDRFEEAAMWAVKAATAK